MKRTALPHRDTVGNVLTRRAIGFITALSLVLGALSWTSFTLGKDQWFTYHDTSLDDDPLPLVRLEEPKAPKPKPPKMVTIITPDPVPVPSPEPTPVPVPDPVIDPDPWGSEKGIDDSFRDTAGDDHGPFLVVEHMPASAGCEHLRGYERNTCTERAILMHLSQNTRFPRRLMDTYDAGSVHLSFVIGTDGKVKDLKILRETHELFGNEVMKAARSLPVFTPGEQQGRKVPVQYVVPVSFRKS